MLDKLLSRIDKLSSKRARKILIVLMVILTIAFVYESFTLANNMKGTLGYVSDECWYVSSSRNILRELFKVQPSYISPDGYYHYSIFFYTPDVRDEMIPSLNDTLSAQYGGQILTKYNNTYCVTVMTQKPLNQQAIKDSIQGVGIIQAGYQYPDNNGIENYMNTEHPPLTKFIIGFFMLSLGDKPIVWRIPSIILGTLMLVLICLIVIKITNNYFIVFLVFLFAFVDSIFMAMSSVAMLDIYAAFFLTLSAWLALRNNYFLSAVSLGLSASAKLTGVFPVVALLIFMLVIRFNVIKSFVYPLIVSPVIWVSANIPFIVHYGLKDWISQVEGGLKWHISPRPNGPPVSSPWGWFYNQNQFALNFKPDVIAKVDPVIYIVALVMLVFIPYIYFKVNKKYLVPTLWFLAGFLGYVGVYFLGNKTLYSFYVITLSPMVYVLAAAFIYYLTEPRTFKDALKSYYAFIRRTQKSKPTQVQEPQQVPQQNVQGTT
jgi:predicted membrane-bound dolichyl-phosphate-mannose-protein mannosyltransferase